jgi:hypothetical protein
MIKYQNFAHYKIPITADPAKYGKLLDHSNNKFICLMITKNIAVINQYDSKNFIRIFKNGELVLEYTDTIINDRSFSRILGDTKFIFENDKLISTQIFSLHGVITIFNDTPLCHFQPNVNCNRIKSYFYLLF